MFYEIIPNRFAPKRTDIVDDVYVASHSICYGRCNFKCVFCDFYQRPNSCFHSFDRQSFQDAIYSLLAKGKNFKFTGGEPTLDPYLEENLQFVKSVGGYIYLDSNGSRPEVLGKLLSKGLVDVLGISLKGLTKKEAQQVSRVKNEKIFWQNVFETLELTKKFSEQVRVIVTSVFTKENHLNRLNEFAQLLSPYPHVFMKINNLQHEESINDKRFHSNDEAMLREEIVKFISNNPNWKNRVIYIPNEGGVSRYNCIEFY